MANTNFDIALAEQSRVFLVEGRARVDHIPQYKSCLRLTALTQGFGDVERVECPDPRKYGGFIEVAATRGATERATSTLEGRLARTLISDLLRLARQRCSIDVQLHFGACQDPSVFNKFDKAIILEDVVLTNYGTEDLGALQSGDNAPINETADISAKNAYEVGSINYARRADSIITNEILDVTICDQISCGECAGQSDGCRKIYAITLAAGGSPGTPPDVVFSVDKGATWCAHDIDTLLTTEDPSGIACLGDYLVIISDDAVSLSYTVKDTVTCAGDPTFTEVTVGFVAAGRPNAIWSVGSYAFIVGNGGYVYGTDDPTGGVTVLDAGVATTDNLNDVHALDENFAVAVGNSGAVIYTRDGVTWTPATTRPTGAGVHLNCVWARSKAEWWVGTNNGRLYYTLDAGITWTESTFSGSGAGQVYDIAFSTDSVGWMAHASATPRGRIFRTYDAGESWVLTPELSNASMPLTDRINALAVCEQDANFVVGVGLHDDAADGVIVLGAA